MPAAAVIPAPIAYIKVVAVKKLVVDFCLGRPMCLLGYSRFGLSIFLGIVSALDCVARVPGLYFEEIRVFHAGVRLEYVSME